MTDWPCRLANPLLLSVIQEYVSILNLVTTCRDCLVASVPVIQLALTPAASAEFLINKSLAYRVLCRVSSAANQLTLSALSVHPDCAQSLSLLPEVKCIRSLTIVPLEVEPFLDGKPLSLSNVEGLCIRGVPVMIGDFVNLKYLSIYADRLCCRMTAGDMVNHFPILQTLEVNVGNIPSPLRSVIGTCCSLEKLSIVTRGKIDIPELVELFPNLKTLELDDYVNKSDLSSLAHLRGLVELTSMVTRKFPVLPRLKTLKLTHYGEGRISRQLVKRVSKMEELERLELIGFKATEFGPLRSLQNLRRLEIRSGLFGDMSFIEELPNLEHQELDYLTEYAECDFDP